ncbi:ATP-dependent RNA helicase SrmB [Candidatus Williamhamiltonella defendens]|uniref:ATP-dependent RNA helicase SrmB n=1 Tax=Candidatus Williamhamiltonella defendens TaxID=138072 RepID=A0A2D3TCE9_9ENTR|nr:ATP-dependent RNA helicase SrmB [Candidatus Hamiltonella defensa]ATW33211.1 ATP-dependent RNA helicase SrmB [Candidatus Hamiltonella defensa]
MMSPPFCEFDLDPCLLRALEDKGYLSATAIQTTVIPKAMEGRDLLGSAPTGTGKTIAFLIPALQHLLDFPKKKPGPPRILILAPTRELAIQVADQATELAKYTSLKVAKITGGVAYMNHTEIFSTNQDILVATTGRLLQYIKEENFDCRAVEILILDEADRMLDMGFAQDIEVISAETRWRKQTLLFSATLESATIREFSERVLRDPIYLEAAPSVRERKKILQSYYRADNLPHKIALLCYLLKTPSVQKSIIFVRTREKVHELVHRLQSEGIHSVYLEGEMVQTKRTEAIARLNSGRIQVLVATDVASRGLDIEDISHVFNFDMPYTGDVYLHRIGRTARAGRKGTAISLIEAHDHLLLKKVERYLKKTIKPRIVDELRPTTKAPNEKQAGKPSKKVLAKREEQKKAKKEKAKVKIRHRDKKNLGKRREPKNFKKNKENGDASFSSHLA